MQYSDRMNPQYGTKWFTFYTKVRPWLACLTSLTVLLDFIQYMDIYLGDFWMFLYFVAAIVHAVLSILVGIKSNGAYDEFFRFVRGVLVFETINMAYGQGVLRYVQDGLNWGHGAFIFGGVLLIDWLIWYLLNVKYFKKRLMYVAGETATAATHNSMSSTSLSAMKPRADMAHAGAKSNQGLKICFCRKCGSRLVDGALFCSKCGTRVHE